MKKPDRSRHNGLILKIGVTWLCFFLVIGLVTAAGASANPVSISVLPEVPSASEPVIASYNIGNPADTPATVSHQLYVNGNLVEEGNSVLAARSSSRYLYAYPNPLATGQQVSFTLRTTSASGNFERSVALPGYPPQLMSSFVSFAAFSTSVMSSIISAEYFTSSFGSSAGINAGIIISLVLTALLVFIELTREATSRGKFRVLIHYRMGLGNTATILFIIFTGMVFANVMMLVTRLY